jgi:hypothetical protein
MLKEFSIFKVSNNGNPIILENEPDRNDTKDSACPVRVYPPAFPIPSDI